MSTFFRKKLLILLFNAIILLYNDLRRDCRRIGDLLSRIFSQMLLPSPSVGTNQTASGRKLQ